MSYTKNIWKSGDTVTSAKLNNMEEGIAAASNGVFVVNDNEGVLDKTYAEIVAAAANNIVILKLLDDDDMTGIAYLNVYGLINNKYLCIFYCAYSQAQYFANSENEYPEFLDTNNGNEPLAN